MATQISREICDVMWRYCYISSRLMVSAFDSGSSGPRFESWPKLLHSVLGKTNTLVLGVTLRWTSIPSREGYDSHSHFMPVSLSSWLACRPLRNLDPRFLPVPSNHYVTWRTSDLLNVLRLILCFSWQITWENGRKIKPSYRLFFPIFLRRKRICSCCIICVTLWSLHSLSFCWLQKINGLLWVERIARTKD